MTDIYYNDEPDNEDAYCDTCQNTGTVECYCGGDMCVCENYGEEPCPDCSRGDL